MNLKSLKNEVLIQNTKNLIREENRLLSKVLAHLHEIETRKLYLALGYGSLFTFAVKELGYSEASAHRRIEAMRFLKKTPQAKTVVEAGKINLSNLSLLERLSREAKAEPQQNVEALNLLQEATSTAEAEIKLRQHFGLENKKRVIKIEVDEETYQLWMKAKESLNVPKDGEALKKLCLAATKGESEKKEVHQSEKARTAGVVLKRKLVQKAEHRCEYVSPQTGRRCDSTYFLECDHKIPYFLGGKTVPQNMRILCAQHNKFLFHELKSADVLG